VATPSGHIYSREAIVQYLLSKNGELKKQKAEYERRRLEVENRRVAWEEKEQKSRQDRFVRKDQGAVSTALVLRDDDAGSGDRGASSRPSSAAKAAKEKGGNSLKHVSYWLATSQPQHKTGAPATGEFDYAREIEALPPVPPDHPPSPMSGDPLKLKQLIPLHLVREGGEDAKNRGKGSSGAVTGKVLCAVSHKAITTQPTIAIKNTGQVMLKSVFNELAKPTMTCPVTAKKFKEKDVVELIKGKSGFAASGEVVAKKYNPTLT
jgi:nitric oxide synthase-interacting protein